MFIFLRITGDLTELVMLLKVMLRGFCVAPRISST